MKQLDTFSPDMPGVEIQFHELEVMEEQLKLKNESLKLQKWHVYAIWIGVAISLLNVLFNTVNIFLIVTRS